MADKKLVIDVEVKRRNSGTAGTSDPDPKVSAEREKQAGKEKLANLKGDIAKRQAILEADIAKTITLLKSAKAKELEAERYGNQAKIKEAIAYRKIMESQLRMLESDRRLLNSKDLAEYQALLKQKAAAERQYNSSLRNAPRTKLSGDVGSLAYVQGLQRMQSQQVPGSDQYNQLGASIQKHTATLNNAGVQVSSLSQKIGGEFKNAVSQATGALGNYVVGMGAVLLIQKAWNISEESAKFHVMRENFAGTTQDVTNFRIATAGAVSDRSLISLSNQATDLGVSLKDQTILFSLAEDAADRYGTTVEEGFQKVVFATEGSTKGLKALGIQKGVYEEIVKKLTDAQKMEGVEIDAEVEKQIRLQAIIQASGVTYDQAINKERDLADQHEMGSVIVQNLKDEYGQYNSTMGLLSIVIGKANIVGQRQLELLGETKVAVKEILDKWGILKREAETPIRLQVEVDGLQNIEAAWQQIQQFRTGNFTSDIGRLSDLIGMSPDQIEKLLRKKGLIGFGKETEGQSGTKNTSTDKSGSTKKEKQEEELNLIKLQEAELAKLNLQLTKNLGDIGAELDLRKKILDVETEIHRLRFGPDFQEGRPDGRGLTNLIGDSLGSFKGGHGKDSGVDEAKRIQKIYDDIDSGMLNAFNQSFSLVQQIDQVLGGGAADVINAFQTAYSITQSIVQLIQTIQTITSLFDLIPGGSAFRAVAGLASGGPADSGRPYVVGEKGMEYFIPMTDGFVIPNHMIGLYDAIERNSTRDNYYASGGYMPNARGGGQPIIYNIIKNPVTFGKALEIETVIRNTRIGNING